MELGIWVFFVGFLGSFFTSVVGGGGSLFTVPMLMFLGFPPQIAIATERLGNVGNASAAFFAFNRAKKVQHKYTLTLVFIGIVGSLLGAHILLQINEYMLSKIIGVLLLTTLPFIFSSKGLHHKVVEKSSEKLGYTGYFFVAIYEGFFGAAGGLISMLVFISFFGLTYIEANATEKLPWLVNTVLTLILFGFYGLVDWKYGFIILIGMVFGGYLGARTALRSGEKVIRIFFFLFVVFAASKLLLF